MVSATENALINTLETPLAVAWVWLCFGETPTVTSFVGGLIVVAAVVAHFCYGDRPQLAFEDPRGEIYTFARSAIFTVSVDSVVSPSFFVLNLKQPPSDKPIPKRPQQPTPQELTTATASISTMKSGPASRVTPTVVLVGVAHAEITHPHVTALLKFVEVGDKRVGLDHVSPCRAGSLQAPVEF